MAYSEVEEKTLSFYRGFNERAARRDETAGKADGKKRFPDAAASDYPFRDEAITHARRALREFGLALSSVIEDLQGKVEDHDRDRTENYARQREDLYEAKKSAIEELDRTQGRQSPNYRHLSEKLDEAKIQLKDVELETQRPLRTSITKIYLPLLALLAVAEVPVNRLAFEFFFSETPIISLFIAFVLGLIIMFCAHYAGVWLRQAPHYPSTTARILHFVGIAVILIVVGVVIYFVAAIRQGYVDLLEREAASDFSSLLQGAEGLQAVAQEALSVSLGTAGLTLLVINVLIFLVGMVAAYVRHDPHPDYERVTRRKEKLEKRLHKIEDRFEKDVSKRSREFDGRIAFLDRKLDQTESEIEEMQRDLAAAKGRKPEVVEMMAEVVCLRILAYQRGNRSVRDASDVPQCFVNPEPDKIVNELSAT